MFLRGQVNHQQFRFGLEDAIESRNPAAAIAQGIRMAVRFKEGENPGGSGEGRARREVKKPGERGLSAGLLSLSRPRSEIARVARNVKQAGSKKHLPGQNRPQPRRDDFSFPVLHDLWPHAYRITNATGQYRWFSRFQFPNHLSSGPGGARAED